MCTSWYCSVGAILENSPQDQVDQGMQKAQASDRRSKIGSSCHAPQSNESQRMGSPYARNGSHGNQGEIWSILRTILELCLQLLRLAEHGVRELHWYVNHSQVCV